jgi:HK97 family phage major capsid protein
MTSLELREQRAGTIKEARELLKKAEAENRELTSEDSEQYDRMMADVDKKKIQIDRMEKLETAERESEEQGERRSLPIDPEPRGGDGASAPTPARLREERQAYVHFLRTGEVREVLRKGQGRLAEYRDSIIGTDAKGGFLVAPTAVSDDIVKVVQDQTFMLQLAGRIYVVTEAKNLGVRKLTTHMGDANWTTEVAAVTEDTTMAFDRRDLTPFLLSKLSKVSLRLLYASADAEPIVNEELSYKFAITIEKGGLTGTGSSQPLGIFTASASGISTARDVSTGNSTTAIGADNLIECVYAVNGGYLFGDKVGWVFHRDAVKQVRKMKDTTNQYLWQPGLDKGRPDTVLRYPVFQSEYAPNTFTTGLYVGVFGNFFYYRWARVRDLIIQRLVELYAGTNEVGFIGRTWIDGAPILENAFARSKLA